MAFVPHHVWVEIDGRTYKVIFNGKGRPSSIQEWRKARGRNGTEFVTYWSSASVSRAGTKSARIIAAAEEIRGV